jgi:hypothetical protein
MPETITNKKGTPKNITHKTYPGGQIIASQPNCRNNILELIAPPPQKIFGTVPVRLQKQKQKKKQVCIFGKKREEMNSRACVSRKSREKSYTSYIAPVLFCFAMQSTGPVQSQQVCFVFAFVCNNT